MNPDLDRPDQPNRPLDDDQLGALVRGVVDDWRMPPQRLDQPTWRDRTRSGPSRRRPWLARLAGPAAAALVATVVLAVAAVWLTAPRGDLGTVGQSPDASGSPSASVDPAGTPLPRLLRNGELPSVTSVMVRADGRYRLADLATGTLGEDALGTYTGPSALVPRPDGGWLCLCGKYTDYGQTGPTALSLTLASIAADGSVTGQVGVRQIEGSADPDRPAELQYGLVDARIGVAPDGATAFFAWIARNGGAGWTSGVDLIDVASASVTSSTELAVDPTTATENGPITRNAPSVSVSPAGDRILLSAFWFVEDPDASDPGYGLERWTAPLDGGTIGEVTPLALQTASDCGELDGGLVDGATYYQLCDFQSGDRFLRRFSLDGTLLGDTVVPRTEGEFSAGSLVARSGDGLFLWDPVGAVLSRVDLRSGDVTTSPTPAASGADPFDALGALGRRLGQWIAPSVLAKLLLEPGLVISPDGSRVYALGVTSSAPTSRGSTGLYAFDAASLAPVGHWEPTADFTSIAVSADGRFVYASALGGVDAAGRASSNGSSVTVFDASDGSVRLIAGELGTTDLGFASPTLE
jgi:hypothetical protein